MYCSNGGGNAPFFLPLTLSKINTWVFYVIENKNKIGGLI